MANMISSFFDPGEAFSRAEDASKEGWERAQSYQRPFFQQGLDQYGRLNTAAGKLFDPMALENEWTQGYQTSPYAQQLLKQNQSAGLDAASAMGLNGSSAALSNIQQGAGNVVAQDRQRYLEDLMKKYMAGIGLGENLYGTGAQVGQNLGGQAMTHGQDQAGLQYGRYNAPGELFGKLAGEGINYLSGGLSNLGRNNSFSNPMLNNLFNSGNNFNASIPATAAAAAV